MAIHNNSDHDGDISELKVKLEDLFSHVQAWQQHAGKQQNASEGLSELKAKAQRLLGLIEKAEQGLAAMSKSSEKLDAALAMLDALGGELRKTASQSAGTIDAHLEASSQEIKKQFADLQQASSEALGQAVAKQVTRLATAEQVAKLSTSDQVTKLATADALKNGLAPLATMEETGRLATKSSIESLEKLVTRVLIASGMAAIFGLIALIHGFLRS